jgi:hypothetical protein
MAPQATEFVFATGGTHEIPPESTNKLTAFPIALTLSHWPWSCPNRIVR